MNSLSKSAFSVLATIFKWGEVASQRDLATRCGLSVGTVNATCRKLQAAGLLEGYAITPAGMEALEPYRVENAVIMAAGLSSRFAPISYEKPKGLLTVRGEVLVERQIRQLQEAGITDITVVVGYKKEFFFYLEDAFGVRIVVNDEYASRNNNSSLMRVREKLGNTYICSSDDYFTENPFERHVYQAYYAAEYCEGPTDEWCMKLGPQNRIVGVTVGGADSWIMLGHVYFDRAFSQTFRRILEAEYDLPETADKLWEELYIDHIKELPMIARKYEPGIIYEFDSLDELRDFDPQFLRNVDSEVFDNIVDVLACQRDDICEVYPLKQGLTNLSCHFSVNGDEYVYRHPGAGTEAIIDRRGEMEAQRIAKRLGLDDTFVYEDPERGWKISRYIPLCKQLDVHDRGELSEAMRIARELHGSDAAIDRTFDFYDESLRYERLLRSRGSEALSVPGFADNVERVRRLHDAFEVEGGRTCLCHNDFFDLNFLIDGDDKYYLIDWEYAGMADSTQDFGTFVVCCQLSDAEAEDALSLYLGHEPTEHERRRHWAAVCFAGWCWYLWSLFKEEEGEFVGEWLYIYYRYATRYLDKALALYGVAKEA